MFKKLLISGCCIFAAAIGTSQELYKPRDIMQAYKNNTRSEDGKPGKNYWQNTANYNIKVNLTPPTRTVRGTEEITYFNNSPDTLRSLNFKLFLNNHKPGAARLYPASPDYLTSGTHIDSFAVNGENREWKDQNDGTNKSIKLKKPLLPKDSIHLAIDWHFDVSKQSGREGAIDSTTFFLAYFYPRIAVYDDYSGWDEMTFTGGQEFYSDFNNYKLEVNVPKNFLVWATGELQNPKEVLQEKYSQLLEQSMKTDSVIRIVTPQDLRENQITRQDSVNTWKWEARDIPDVTFAVSNQYNWDAGSVELNDENGRKRVSVQAAYDDASEDFHHMVKFGKHALKWFAENYPGIAYPYPKTTIVRGYADMEYPMMVNDNSAKNLDEARFVVEHEIAHTYFPFYMGTNETRFGFMDEGWATALEHLIGIADLGEEQAVKNFQNFRVRYWAGDPSMEEDLPIITPSNILSGHALGNNEYGKAALGYLAVKDLLGDEGFTKALQGYMKRWNGKHPIPWDFFYSFNDISGKNLNWFWDAWYFSNNYIDYALEDVEIGRKEAELKIKNIGGMPAPFDIVVTTEDGKTKTIHKSPELWKDNTENVEVEIEDVKNISKIEINGGIFMDADPSNNSWKKD